MNRPVTTQELRDVIQATGCLGDSLEKSISVLTKALKQLKGRVTKLEKANKAS